MYVINEKTKIVNSWADNEINRQRLASGNYGVVLYTGEVEEFNGVLYAKGFAPALPSLAEQALGLAMTKAEFLILVTGLTKNMETPITLEAIELMLASNADIRMRFTYANTVERNHPMLNDIADQFGVSSEMLDIMFINKDDLIYKIDNNLPLE